MTGSPHDDLAAREETGRAGVDVPVEPLSGRWPRTAHQANRGAPADGDAAERWAELDRRPVPMAGRHVLVVGENTASDTAVCAARGAQRVHALPLTALDPDAHGRFDVIHCHGLLHRVPDPITVLLALRRMAVTGAALMMSTVVLDDPERAEDLRLVPDRHRANGATCLIPGPLALRAMLATAGFTSEIDPGQAADPISMIPVRRVIIHAIAVKRPPPSPAGC